jgi:hypothetical protein
MATIPRSLLALLVVCTALAVNAFVLGPMWILAPAEQFSDTVAIPAFAHSQRASWLLLTLLVPLVPSLVRPGRRGTPPAWVAPVVQVALAAQAATHFVQGFVLPWLLPVAPEAIDLTTDGGALKIALITVWVFFLAVNLTFAVTLWRAGHSRLGAVLMGLGAVVTPAFGPFGAGLLAVGLGVQALTIGRSVPHAHAHPLVPTTA